MLTVQKTLSRKLLENFTCCENCLEAQMEKVSDSVLIQFGGKFSGGPLDHVDLTLSTAVVVRILLQNISLEYFFFRIFSGGPPPRGPDTVQCCCGQNISSTTPPLFVVEYIQ